MVTHLHGLGFAIKVRAAIIAAFIGIQGVCWAVDREGFTAAGGFTVGLRMGVSFLFVFPIAAAYTLVRVLFMPLPKSVRSSSRVQLGAGLFIWAAQVIGFVYFEMRTQAQARIGA